MTREEREIALYCLKASSDYHSEVCEECVKYPNCDPTIQDDVTETIIKALEQEPCEDCVSRKEVLDLCDSKDPEYKVSHLKEDVECLPSVAPKLKTAKWIEIDIDVWECSECGGTCFEDKGNYCPCCGAKMRGE